MLLYQNLCVIVRMWCVVHVFVNICVCVCVILCILCAYECVFTRALKIASACAYQAYVRPTVCVVCVHMCV